MRDRLTPPLNPSLRALLSPADGFDPKQEMFTESPIEALDWLHELGKIAKESIEPFVEPPPAVEEAVAAAPIAEAAPAAPVNEESRLVEALLEYHRLRTPAVGARTSPRPSKYSEFTRVDSSAEPKNHFSPLDIPVVKNAAPKAPGSSFRSAQPTQTVLRPKNRP